MKCIQVKWIYGKYGEKSVRSRRKCETCAMCVQTNGAVCRAMHARKRRKSFYAKRNCDKQRQSNRNLFALAGFFVVVA